ncbi:MULTISPECIES: xanthine dehydrogenase family protein molybdopterin-binding subunit [Pseudomonas]|uniref:Isoquinoline 1-oxidoreductase, beta subunit n=1 Tax=Pseudomonas lutea TaxID=243924 RepID=A0A9X8MA87_9PSED|nr:MULTISPECIES: xanthine dehydrogenase family protein molybdopterin-binding subunit [Pseudomonas]MBW5411760.1 molybdopterin-dependent oxidoreductase [Pseudomonas sp. MAG002Y]RRW47837.1 xanthine dehydrogenase family protein molybdopterin-binding subunit [Pseudomonas luteola]SEP98269.1 isoquinoline 1-oxidoreductase, beta subunit [Pseudomonas lutea]
MTKNVSAQAISLSRRKLLQASGIAAGGLLLATALPFSRRSYAEQYVNKGPEDAPLDTPTALGAFLRIGHDGQITLISPKIEMGQGVQTGFAMMVAEELNVTLDQVRVQEAPPDEKLYGDKLLGFQATGGSSSTRSNWQPLREAAAAARVMLIQAAANQWKVSPDECRAENGKIIGPGNRELAYGALVDAAAKLPVPENVPLKKPEDYKVIGQPLRRLDTPGKVDGSAKFTIDLHVPGMKIATVSACPVVGGTLASVDDRHARAVPGVRDVVKLDNAVAVIGDHMWAALKGLKALEIQWDLGPNAGIDSAQIERALHAAFDREGAIAAEVGDINKAIAGASSKIEAEYEMPFLAHATLEPMTCVAQVREDACELWVGTQVPVMAQQAAAKATGLPPEKIIVNNQLIGGGFGRRLEADFIGQAAAIAKQVDYPIKLVWTREEDTAHDLYRPHYIDRFSAGLDANGMPVGWSHTIVGASVMARFAPAAVPPNGLDADAVEVSNKPVYSLPNLRVRYVPEAPKAILNSWWRGVGPLHGAYVMESFIDELAYAAKQDPVDYRMKLLGEHPRAQAVLKLAAEKANWSQKLPAGHGRGIAVQEVFGSYLATVVEMQVDAQNGIHITRLICIADCGEVTNPTSVHSQLEGGTLFGLSAALYNEITVKDGHVEQSNFHDYRQLRMSDAPPVETHIIPSHEIPGGIGEAGTAMIAPALVNALYAATGKRIRRLPVVRAGYHVA